MSTMVDRRPQSPRSSDLPYGLRQLADHAAGSPLQQEWHHEEVHSSPQFASPGLMHHSPDPFVSQSYGDNQYPEISSRGMGLGIDYAGSESPMPGYVAAESQGFPSPQYLHAGVNDGSMTPMSQHSEGARRTRSGRSATRSNSPHPVKGENGRVTKPSRSKKGRSNKAFNSKMPRLEAPLSELTKGMALPTRDMEEWVNRSAETRQQEVIKRNGYVTRPMNSFMLYRSAYAERTKQWCLQNNHQVVSSVSGESWPLESEEVREHYNNLARIERDNHARAHPSYKFSPSKTPAAKKKRSGEFSDEEDELSSIGDPDREWVPKGERRSHGRPRRQGRDMGYPHNGGFHQVADPYQYQFDGGMGMNMPTWDMSGQGRPLPQAMGPEDIYSQFYQSMGQQSLGLSGFANGQGQMGGMHGLYPDLDSQPTLFAAEPQATMKDQVDPMLLQMNERFDQGVGTDGLPLQGQMLSPDETHQLFGGDGGGVFENWMDQHQ